MKIHGNNGDIWRLCTSLASPPPIYASNHAKLLDSREHNWGSRERLTLEEKCEDAKWKHAPQEFGWCALRAARSAPSAWRGRAALLGRTEPLRATRPAQTCSCPSNADPLTRSLRLPCQRRPSCTPPRCPLRAAQPRGAPACTAPPRRWGRGGHGGGRRNCGGPRRTGDGEGAVAEEQGRGRLGPSWWSGYRGGLSLRNRWGVENRLSLWPLNGWMDFG